MESSALFRTNELEFFYHRGGRRTHAVKSVSFNIDKGEILGIVGESGCGKSSLARLLAGLAMPDSGTMELEGKPLPYRRSRKQRREVQMVFQDPRSALNPRMTVLELISEGWSIHPEIAPADRRQGAVDLLDKVGLGTDLLGRRPDQVSGGQAQRVGIARALAVSPKLLICDEAVSALDVSAQTQVLRLLAKIRQEMQLAIIFISHDLGVVRQISDRVAVMYFGEIVELEATDDVFERPSHDYSRRLVSAALDLSFDGSAEGEQ